MTDQAFEQERRDNIARMAKDDGLWAKTLDWMALAQERKYSYQFDWLGLPIIQYPQDIVAMQELVWSLKPDLVIETGIARGGSAIFYASLLELNALCGGPKGAEVVAVDIDIRAHNRKAIEAHPMSKRLTMIQGRASIPASCRRSRPRPRASPRFSSVWIPITRTNTSSRNCAPMRRSSRRSYCVVFDTLVEDLPATAIGERPWAPGNNPMTALEAYLKEDKRFEIDEARHHKLQITVARKGYLKRAR